MLNFRLTRALAIVTGLCAVLLTPHASVLADTSGLRTLHYEVFSSPESQFKTNSVIVYGEEHAILIDATFTKSSADVLAEKIKKLGRKLTAIYLTHGHPDHALSVNRLLHHFPGIKIYASLGVQGELERDFYAKLVRWQIEFPDDLSPVLPPVETLDSAIRMEGHEIQWMDVIGGESWDATVFFIPSSRTLIPGDMIFNKMHLYNADVYRPQKWIDILDSFAPAFGRIDTVIPGHGEVTDAGVISENREYLEEFISVATLPFPDLVKVHDHMVQKYPDWSWPMIVAMTRGPAITYPQLMQRYAPK